MALPATDTFTTDTNEQELTAYSANWSYCQGAFRLSSADDGVYSGSAGAETGAYWNADSFSNDQYAQVTYVRAGTNCYVGPAVRGSASNYYGWYGVSTESVVFRVKSSSWSQLTPATGSLSAFSEGVTYRLEVTTSGSDITLVAKANGVEVATFTDNTTNGLTSGAAGLSGYGSGAADTGSLLDNWEGGNLGGVTDVPRDPGVGSLQVTGSAGTLAFTMPPGAGAMQFVGAAPTVLNELPKQYAYPTSDVSNESWTASVGSDLYACVNEAGTADDDDYIRSPDPSTGQAVVLQLGSLNTPDAGAVTLRIRAKWVA